MTQYRNQEMYCMLPFAFHNFNQLKLVKLIYKFKKTSEVLLIIFGLVNCDI